MLDDGVPAVALEAAGEQARTLLHDVLDGAAGQRAGAGVQRDALLGDLREGGGSHAFSEQLLWSLALTTQRPWRVPLQLVSVGNN